MALNTLRRNHLTPLRFKRLIQIKLHLSYNTKPKQQLHKKLYTYSKT